MKAIPILWDTIDIDEKQLPTINAASAYVDNFVSIKKREGFFKRFRGTLGKRVKDEVKAEKKAERKAGNDSSSQGISN